MAPKELAPAGPVDDIILEIRGQKVILDSDLARIYAVEVKALNRAVRRNRERFPDDFIFQLTTEEWDALKCQFGTSKGRGGRRYLPYVFTEHGAVMAASMLNSRRAIRMSVFVVRAFVRLRLVVATHKELAAKLAELEQSLATHDGQIQVILRAIRQLMTPPMHSRKQIGFRVGKERRKG